jgi:drug/metabolite transporter (DMT)-like permease
MSKQLQADGILFLITFCWGVSYFLMDICLGEIDPFTLNAFRFLGAFAIAVALSGKKLSNVSKETLKYALIVGSLMVFVYIGATFGVKYTTISNSGFMCSLTVIFTPIMEWIVFKKRPSKKFSLVLLICITGIALLTLGNDFSLNMAHLKGDLLCVMCAFSYAILLIFTEIGVSKEEVDPYQMGVFQIGITGVLNLVMAFVLETPHFPETMAVWGAVAFLAIFCTGVAYIMQPIAMQYTSAGHVGVIFALEPVFSAIVAFMFAGEVLFPKQYLGGALMLFSIILMEVDIKSFIKRR